jgi:predicted ester cyclase
VFGSLHCAFPDLHLTIEDLIAEGDKVASRDTNSGTHRGAFMGVAATGKAVTYNETFIARFAAGRIVESWAIVDALSLMRQLGLVPGGLGQSPLQADGGPASHPLPTSSR